MERRQDAGEHAGCGEADGRIGRRDRDERRGKDERRGRDERRVRRGKDK